MDLDISFPKHYFDGLLSEDRKTRYLNPGKLHVKYADVSHDSLKVPRRYTLTHSDFTGDLYLTIGPDYDYEEISNWKTKLMRDEVLAELLVDEQHFSLHVFCYVSGGLVLGTAEWRYNIFKNELPLVLEAIRYGDRDLFAANPELDESKIIVNFKSSQERFQRTEEWGKICSYR